MPGSPTPSSSATRHSPEAGPGLADELLREAGWVRALALKLARDQAVADDVAQSTMALALERQPATRDGLRPWLARVVDRLTRRERRSAARRLERERRVAAERGTAAASDELLERLELQQDLAERVRRLPEPYRGVLLRRYYEGQSAGEIARETGTSAATVRSQLARGLERLRHDFARGRREEHLYAGGALPLLLVAAGSTRGSLSKLTLEIIAMETTTKVAATAVVIAAAFVVSRALSEPPPKDVHVQRDTIVAAGSNRVSADVEAGLAEVGGEANREGLVDVGVAAPAADGQSGVGEAPEDDVESVVSIVRAQIVDARGDALPDIELRSIYSDGRPRGVDCFALSDSDGLCEISIENQFMCAFRTDVFPMAFRASGRYRETVFVVSTPRWHGVTDLGLVELAEGGAIRGTLVDGSGRALAGATVTIGDAVNVERPDVFRLVGPDKYTRRPRAITDDNGRFEFPGARCGALRLYAGQEGKLWTVTGVMEVSLRSTTDVGRIVLDEIPAGELIAGVVRRPDGAPAAGAKVSYVSQATRREGTLSADASGRFAFCPGGSGGVEFLARDPEGTFGMSASVTSARGADNLVLELTVRRVIVVTVTDQDGEPIAEAALMPILTDHSVFAGGGRPVPGGDWFTTDETGQVDVDVPNADFQISASLRGYEGRRFGPFAPTTAPEALQVELQRDPIIAGTVLSSGAPVRGVRIQIGQRLEGLVSLEAGFPNWLVNTENHEIQTDAAGRFECPVDPSWETVTVLAFRDGLATGEVELTLEPGEGAKDVVVEMTAGGVVSGSVLAPVGHVVTDLFIAASRGDGHPVWTRVRENATYELKNLAPGPWRIEGRVKEPSRTTIAIAQTPEEREFNWNVDVIDTEAVQCDIDMRAQGHVALHGHLLIDGEPAVGWRATLQLQDDEYSGFALSAAKIDESGGFVLSVPAGRVDLVIAGHFEGGSRVEIVRVLDLKGTRVDWEEVLTTGPVSEQVEAGIDEVRVHVGAAYRGDRTSVYLEPDASGQVNGRSVVGTARMGRSLATNFGLLWKTIRTIDVRQ